MDATESKPESTATSDRFEPLTERIIGCAITVHRALGPGLLESIYRDCLVIELLAEHVRVQCDVPVPITYRGQRVGSDLKIDLLAEGCVVVEVKSVAAIHPVHSAQVITYLKLTGHPVGLLMNFNTTSLRAGLKRLEHPDLYLKKQLSSSG